MLALKYQVQSVTYVTLTEAHDACLLVGNEGLRQRRGSRDYPHTYDLGEEWHQWTGLPFVFARWIVRKDLDRQAAAVLEDALYGGLQDWADGLFRSATAARRADASSGHPGVHAGYGILSASLNSGPWSASGMLLSNSICSRGANPGDISCTMSSHQRRQSTGRGSKPFWTASWSAGVNAGAASHTPASTSMPGILRSNSLPLSCQDTVPLNPGCLPARHTWCGFGPWCRRLWQDAAARAVPVQRRARGDRGLD